MVVSGRCRYSLIGTLLDVHTHAVVDKIILKNRRMGNVILREQSRSGAQGTMILLYFVYGFLLFFFVAR